MFNVKRVGFDDQGKPGSISVGTVADKVVLVLPTTLIAGLTTDQARELAAALDATADQIGAEMQAPPPEQADE